MSNEQIIADLQATRDRMTPENWSCHGWVDGESLCVQGHLIEVITGRPFYQGRFKMRQEWSLDSRYNDARGALREHLPHPGSVGLYNDSGASFADIQNLIDKTLADLGGL